MSANWNLPDDVTPQDIDDLVRDKATCKNCELEKFADELNNDGECQRCAFMEDEEL